MEIVNIWNIIRILIISITFYGCKSGSGIYSNPSVKNQQITDVDPIIRVYPHKVDTILFDNLRFVRLTAVNGPNSPEVMTFRVNGFSFMYEGKRFYSENGVFSANLITQIYADKPTKIMIDTVYLIDQNKSVYKENASLEMLVTYPNENRFSCLEKQKSLDFKALLKSNPNTDELRIIKDQDNCPIICFYNLGSIFTVEITAKDGSILYKKDLMAGELNIDNYFAITNESELNVKIVGDFNWTGRIIIH